MLPFYVLLLFAAICCSNGPGPVAAIGIRQGALQDIVTWDAHSIMVRGERIMFYSGEFHPFRLPVPGLWLDVFQKIKAMGFNGVSFYVYWGLLEGNPGHVVTDGIWALDDFFQAASDAGIYLIARPGPYINAECAAGGMPGWTLRINSMLRSDAPDYTDRTELYLSTIGKTIARAQITNGGPVVLVQPENEYATWPGTNSTTFPLQLNRNYMAFVEDQLRHAGIVVPFLDNDNEAQGYWAPGSGLGSVQLYGIDAYPLRYDCANPSVWPTYRFPRDYNTMHEQDSPSTPFAIPEFQGGSGTSWQGVDQGQCNALVNEEAVRVVYKNNYGFGVKLFSIYMTYGGTNWGNLGYSGGDTSYDYGAAITEDRHVWREKYSEEKLEANFFKVSPAYLTAAPINGTNGTYASTDSITVTPLLGSGDRTNFYVVRQADFTSLAHTTYRLTVNTSIGTVTIPQLGGDLSIIGRDSKIQVTDYDVGGLNLIYCTADIFTWQSSSAGKRVLVVQGGASETHELAFPAFLGQPTFSTGSDARAEQKDSVWVVQWQVDAQRQIAYFGDHVEVHLLWRNAAYNYWVMELPAEEPIANYWSPSKSSVVVNAGYLVRNASISGTELRLCGDVNSTTLVELIYEPTGRVDRLTWNGKALKSSWSSHGKLSAVLDFREPAVDIPDISNLEWRTLDSLPEINAYYNDSLWTSCDHNTTTNPIMELKTPTSLFASDYGYHTGSLLYRGHFTANGEERTLFINTSAGSAFSHSIWLGEMFLGSWIGANANVTYSQTLNITNPLQTGTQNIITILLDHMGQTEEAPGTDAIKSPIGILDYSFSGHDGKDITWKMTGNLGGEQYHDLTRGPRNEGAMYAERQGYHLPKPPSQDWTIASPIHDGLSTPGVQFYTTTFDLHVPLGYDVPVSFVFENNTLYDNGTKTQNYRVQLFVNGYQFGKYVSNLGPQTDFPVPEGILNYNGTNYISFTLWALDPTGAKLGGLQLVPKMPVLSGYSKPPLSPQPAWMKRIGAY